MSNFKTLIAELEILITDSYESGVSMEQAERLAGRFLTAQMLVSSELRKADLSSRMRKTGLKAVRAATYLEQVEKNEKKPSDVLINSIVDTSTDVIAEQHGLDESEVDRDELERLYSIYQNAHIHFRTIAKGTM